MMHNLFTTLSGDTLPGQQSELLARILDEYLRAVERGERVSPEELLARHPDVADELRGYLSGLKKLHCAVGPVADHLAWLSSGPNGPVLSGELGDFRFVRELGRGGMGVVYEALQISLGRRVALKVLPFSATVDEKQIARFKNEAQAAAQVDHPHIVPVFAIGQAHGIHYFAMQLIGGQSLNQLVNRWRDAAGSQAAAQSASTHSRTAETLDRLRMICTMGIQAAEALHAAHEIGVVHRDVKPSNLLIDEKGKLWVTDFGVARCKTNGELTETGGIVGTLRYMSPEQAQGQAALVDQRTDVYSLGVTLYELATLRHPFEDVPDASLPSESARANCRPPRYWNRSIPADFENIVLKAMSVARDERYATARELAEDLQRFQEGRPIHARRPSVATRLGKWATRHRRSVIAATGALALAAAGLAVSLVIVASERTQKDRALQVATAKFRQAREMLDRFGARVNQGLASEVPGAEAVRKQLLTEMLPYYRQFASESANDPGLQADLAMTFTKIGDLSDQLGSLADAEEAYQSARAIFERLAASKSAAPEQLQNLALCCNNLAQVLQKRGAMDAARQQFDRAVVIQQRLVAGSASSDDYRSGLATTYSNLGLLLSQSGDNRGAVEHFRRAIEIQQSLLGTGPEDEAHLKSLAASYNNLSVVFLDSEPETARQWLDQALTLELRLVRSHPEKRDYQSDLALTYNNLGTTLARLSQWTDSERCLADATTIQSRLTAVAPLVARYRRDLSVSYNNLGMTQSGAGDLAAAEKSFEKALAIQQQLTSAHPQDAGLVSALGGIFNNLGMVHQRQRKWSQACADFEQAIEQQRLAHEQAKDVAHYRESLSKHYYNYAQLQLTLGRPAEAAKAVLARRSLWKGDAQRLLKVAHDLAAACKQMPPGGARERNLAEVRATLESARSAGLKTMPDLAASPFDVLASGSGGAMVNAQPASGAQSGLESTVQ